MAVRFAAILTFAFLVTACAGTDLERVGDAMVRVERGTQGIADGVSAAKEIVKDECAAKQLETEAERMACVEDILAVVRGSKTAVQAVRAALVTFWSAYPVLESKLERGEKLTAADFAELAQRADDVYSAYSDLVRYAKETKQ